MIPFRIKFNESKNFSDDSKWRDFDLNRNAPCFCGSNIKHKKCHPDIHPESRAAMLIKIYQEIDARIQDYQTQYQISPPCHKGCSACCYDQFNVSQVEFELIIREIKANWTQEEIEELFNRSLEYIEIVKKEDPELYDTLEKTVGPKDRTLLHRQASQMKERPRNSFPCPFLDTETGACKVYDVRPFMCRSHGVGHINKDGGIPVHSEDAAVCSKILSRIENEKVTPDVSNLKDKQHRISHPYDERYDASVTLREYPIFYYFKIIHDKSGGKKEARFVHDRKNFSVSMEQDNREWGQSVLAWEKQQQRISRR